MASNALTFAGFLFTVLNFALFSKYDYYYYGSSDDVDKSEYPAVPKWVFAMAAFDIFMATYVRLLFYFILDFQILLLTINF